MIHRVSYTHNPMVPGDLVASEEAIRIDPASGLILRLIDAMAAAFGPTGAVTDGGVAFIYLGDDGDGIPCLYHEGQIFVYVDIGNERPFNVMFRRISGDPDQA